MTGMFAVDVSEAGWQLERVEGMMDMIYTGKIFPSGWRIR